MHFNSPFWNEPPDLTPQHILYNALGRNLLHRLNYAQRRPHEQQVRMIQFPDTSDAMTIDNTRILNIFNRVRAAWDKAVNQNASQERLENIIQKARGALHREVWLADRDMDSPVFRDVADFPAHIRTAEFDTNWGRFVPDIWREGIHQNRPEAPWYRMHSERTMDRLAQHGTDNRKVHDRGFINRDYDILKIHDDGLKQYLRTPNDLRRIHEDTCWKMSLLNYLAGGRDSDRPFNLHRYPHHLQRFFDEVIPWNLHGRDIRHLRDWYERTRSPLNDVPDDDGIVLPVEDNDDADDDDDDDDDDDADDDNGDEDEGEEEEG
jgi:hypothetical protein